MKRWMSILSRMGLLIGLGCGDKDPVSSSVGDIRTSAGEIFFSAVVNNSVKIFSIFPDGSNRQETLNGVIFSSPRFNKMVFIWRLIDEETDQRIFYSSTTGKNVRQIASSDSHKVVTSPILSPRGDKVIFLDHETSALYIIGSEGNNEIILADNAAYETIPSFSPDGQFIAFYGGEEGDEKLYVVNSGGSNSVAISDSAYNEIDGFAGLDWSPQGDKIVFVGKNTDDKTDIFVVNADGSGKVNLTSDSNWNGMPVWSPDGTKIAFVNDRDIWIADADGAEKRDLTNTSSFSDVYPQWSPDGKKIVYTTLDSEDFESLGTLRIIDINSSESKVLSSDAYKGFWEY